MCIAFGVLGNIWDIFLKIIDEERCLPFEIKSAKDKDAEEEKE